jgi:hypothetical protein
MIYTVQWAAGVFEGEGSFGIYNRQKEKNKYPNAVMSMTDEDVMRSFLSVVMIGTLRGPYTRKEVSRPIWRWEVTRRSHFCFFAQTMIPYLHSRRLEQLQRVVGECKLTELTTLIEAKAA